ncbi:hypothetical protein ACLOJK_002051 [Asimina triloba]
MEDGFLPPQARIMASSGCEQGISAARCPNPAPSDPAATSSSGRKPMARLKSSSNHLWHSRTSVRPAPINNKSIGTHSGRRPIPIGLAAAAKTSGNLNSNPKFQPQSMVSTTHQARRASDHHHRPIGSYKVDLGQIQHPPADDIQPRTSSSPAALPDRRVQILHHGRHLQYHGSKHQHSRRLRTAPAATSGPPRITALIAIFAPPRGPKSETETHLQLFATALFIKFG